jgi:nucleotidyltransferase/DNA polymerase involved in DNA repair
MSDELHMTGREVRVRMKDATDFVEDGGRVVVSHRGQEAYAIVGMDDLELLRGFREADEGDTISLDELRADLAEADELEQAIRAVVRLAVDRRTA